jgi:hypothetical protein
MGHEASMTRAGIGTYCVKWGISLKSGIDGLDVLHMSMESATQPVWTTHGYLHHRYRGYLTPDAYYLKWEP